MCMYGGRIKALRKEAGKTLGDMSIATGFPTSTIGYLEKQEFPNLGYIVRALEYFGKTFADFFGYSKNEITDREKKILQLAKIKLSVDDQIIFWNTVEEVLRFKIGK